MDMVMEMGTERVTTDLDEEDSKRAMETLYSA
jgi:hypothetical protein